MTEQAATLDVIMARASPIRLGDPGPNAEETRRIVAAGLRAPDHGQLHPWKFLLIEGQARGAFGELLGESLRRRDPGASGDALRNEAAKAMRAPLVIVAAAAPRDTSKVPLIEQVAATAAAVQNLTLAAHALGFGAFWRTGPAAYDPNLKRSLGLAEADLIVGFIYIGTVVAPGRPKLPQADGVVEVWNGPVHAGG